MTNIAYIILAVVSFALAIVSLYSAVCSLRNKSDFMFAAESVFAVGFIALMIMCGVKVWW